MKPFTAILLGCAGLIVANATSRAAGTANQEERTVDNAIALTDTPMDIGERRAWKLTRVLNLTAAQNEKIAVIFAGEITAINALGNRPPAREQRLIRYRTADQIRTLLTARQKEAFNLIPYEDSGGLFGLSPQEQADRLDSLVNLTRAQKAAALNVYIAETEKLMENLEPEKIAKGWDIRFATDETIRALLTPKQQKIWDATPESKGGGDRNR
jgi:hypothetical protein